MCAASWVKCEREGAGGPLAQPVKEELDTDGHASSGLNHARRSRQDVQDTSSELRAVSAPKRHFTTSRRKLLGAHRTSRATSRQIQGLVDFMLKDKDLAMGRVVARHGRIELKNRWMAIAKSLNLENHSSSRKTILQWQKVWRDLKTRTRQSLVTLEAARRESKDVRPYTEIEEKVAQILEGDLVPRERSRRRREAEKSVSVLDDDEDGDSLAMEPGSLNYVNCDESEASQLESFVGWGDESPPPSPARRSPRRRRSARRQRKLKKRLGRSPPAPERTPLENGAQEEERNESPAENDAQDPLVSITQRHNEMYTQFIERLLTLEEARRRADAERDEHRVWYEQKRLELEERRLELAERGLRQGRELAERTLRVEERRLAVEERRLGVEERRTGASAAISEGERDNP